MKIVHNGITVDITDAEVVRLALQSLNDAGKPKDGCSFTVSFIPTELRTYKVPRVGEYWREQGGHFAGIMRDEKSGGDYALILGPEPEGNKELTQPEAMKWATGLRVDSHADFDLPRRKEQRLLFANVQHLFKAEGYWSGEQHESDSSNAWYQGFNYGGQDNWYKLSRFRARAVRRLPL